MTQPIPAPVSTVESAREAELIVSNMEGATQVEFSEEYDYRSTLVLNVKAGLERHAAHVTAALQQRLDKMIKERNEIKALLGLSVGGVGNSLVEEIKVLPNRSP